MRNFCGFMVYLLLFSASYAQGEAKGEGHREGKPKTLSTEVVDFGEVREVRTAEVVVYNNTPRAMVITDVQSHCGCTRFQYSKRPVMVGDSTVIGIRYNPQQDARGVFYKTARIETTASDKPLEIVVRGINKTK